MNSAATNAKPKTSTSYTEDGHLKARQKRRGNLTALLFFSATLVFIGIFTQQNVFLAGNDTSRFAHMESLADYGVSYIDQSRYSWTVDKVTINGHDYSNKPPVPAIIGAGVYLLIREATGWTFATHETSCIYLLTLILAGIPTAFLVAMFYLALGVYPSISPVVRHLTTVALAVGTILTSYSVTLNNHTNTAALIFAALYAAWNGRGVLAGMALTLAICFEPSLGIGFVPVVLWIVSDKKKSAGFDCLVSLCLGAMLFLGANQFTVGSILLPKMVPGAIDHSSYFSNTMAGVLLPQTWYYPFAVLFGGHGFFSVSPVLLFGIAGVCRASMRQIVLKQSWCIFIAVTLCAEIFFHIIVGGSYSGWAYGFRYLIPLIPVILFFIPAAINAFSSRLYAIILPVSILFAVIGVYNPWPPCYEQEAHKDPIASMVTNPVGGNAAAFLGRHWPNSALSDLTGYLFVNRDPALRDMYYYYFFISKGDIAFAMKYRVTAGKSE